MGLVSQLSAGPSGLVPFVTWSHSQPLGQTHGRWSSVPCLLVSALGPAALAKPDWLGTGGGGSLTQQGAHIGVHCSPGRVLWAEAAQPHRHCRLVRLRSPRDPFPSPTTMERRCQESSSRCQRPMMLRELTHTGTPSTGHRVPAPTWATQTNLRGGTNIGKRTDLF